MSKFYVVYFYHSPKDNGRYIQLETVFHLHDDGEGFNNHRCQKTEEGQYYCPGCKLTFSQEEVSKAPHREISKDKNHWVKTLTIGQHQKKETVSHVHAGEGIKATDIDSNGLDHVCLACKDKLDLFAWKETLYKTNKKFFAGVISEQEEMSVWTEISEFMAKKLEIWLRDGNENFFFLDDQFQLLPAKNENDVLYCGNHRFLDNDDRKCLLFKVEAILTQDLIDQEIRKDPFLATEDFHLEIHMADGTNETDDSPRIAQKPETSRKKYSTQKFSSGDLAAVQGKPETGAKSIILGDNQDPIIIPQASEEDLNSATPLPEEAHPLLVPDSMKDEIGNDSDEDAWGPKTVMVMTDIPKMIITTECAEVSGEISMPTMTDEASNAKPKASFPQTLELCLQGIQPLNDALNPESETPDPMETADSNLLSDQQIIADSGLLPMPDFSETEDQWFAEMEPPVEETAEPSSEPATSTAEAPLPETNDSPDDEQTVKKALDKALAEAETMEKRAQAENEEALLAKLAQTAAEVEQLEEVCIQLMMQTQLTNASNATSTVAEATTDTNEAKVIEQENTMPLGDASSFAKASDDKPDGKPTAVLPTMTELPLPETDNSLADKQSVKEALDKALAEVLVTTALPTTEEMSSDYSLPETIHSDKQKKGVSRHCWECNKSMPANQACSDHEKVCPQCGLAYLITEQVCRNCQSDASQPEPGTNTTPKPATENAPSAPNNAVWREAMIKTALTGIAFVVVVMLSTGFAWMINYFQRDDLKDELKAAELRRAEIASQTNESQVKADLTRFDLMETRQATERLQKELSAMEEQKKRLAEEIDSLEKRQVNIWAWQADVQEFLVKANNQLQTNFAKLKDETRNNQLAWQRQERERSDLHWNALFKQNKELISQQTLFAKKWENKLQELLKQPSQVQEPPFGLGLDFNVRTKAKTFCPEFLQAVIKWQAGIKKQVQLKMAEDKNKRKKEAATLLVLKTPLLLDISKFLTQNNPPLVDKSAKTSPKTAVDKSQKTLVIKAEKSAGKPNQKTSKKDQETVYKMEDLVHVWTGPTYF